MNSVVHTTHRDSRFATIHLSAIEDPRLTATAKALHTYGISRSKGWDFNTRDVFNRFREGKDAITAALKLLEETGYLVRHRIRVKGRYVVGYEWFEQPGVTSADLPEWMNRSGSTGADKPTADNPEHSINQEELTTEVLTKEEDGTPPPAPVTGVDWSKQHIDSMNPWYATAQNLRRKLKAHIGSNTVWLATKLRDTYGDIYTPEQVDAQIDKRAAEGWTGVYWELFKEGNNGHSRRTDGTGRGQPSRYAAIIHEKDAGGTDAGVLLSDLYDGRDI